MPDRRRNLVFAAVVVVSFFALVEALLWASGVPTLMAERDPLLGFSRRVRAFQEDPARGVFATPPRAVARSFNYQEFRSRKPEGGFRLFVLGGSSAAGFPWGAEIAFAKVLGDALRASHPERSFESVNAAAMSYGSHRLRVLAHELLEYQPDILAVYEGHNEFVETRFYREVLGRAESLDAPRALLYRWRLYSLMVRLTERLRGAARGAGGQAPAADAGALLGLDVVREDAAGTLEPEKRRVRGLFEENLRAILDLARRRGVRVVLCTVPSNLRDWPPNQSVFDPSIAPEARDAALNLLEEARGRLERGEAAAAAGLLERAARLAPGYAATEFHLGRAHEAAERWQEARAAYARARDADAQPARASTALNDTIRRVAAGEGAILVDVERAFEEASPHGLIGFDLIEDYVHPTPGGHRLIALELWKAFEERGLPGPPRAADASDFWKAVGKAPSGEEAARGSPGAPMYLYNQALVLEQRGLVGQAIVKYRSCLELDPGYYAAAYNLGRLLHLGGESQRAADQFRAALAARPDHMKSILGLAMALVDLGQPEEAERTLARATDLDPRSAEAFNALGHAQLVQGKLALATSSFRKAVDLDARNGTALTNLGGALLRQGHPTEAIARFRESLAIQHDSRRARNGLADALAAAGRLEEAERLYRLSLHADPNDRRAQAGLRSIQSRRQGAVLP